MVLGRVAGGRNGSPQMSHQFIASLSFLNFFIRFSADHAKICEVFLSTKVIGTIQHFTGMIRVYRNVFWAFNLFEVQTMLILAHRGWTKRLVRVNNT